jgi:hypothetical protein
MTAIVAVYRLIAALIQVGFKSEAINKSEYNAFVSENIIDATYVDGSFVGSITPAQLKVSKGSIGSTPINSVDAVNGNDTLTVNWDNSLAPVGSASTDLAYVGILNTVSGEWATASGAATRADGAMDVDMPETITTGDVYGCYLFFKSASDEDVSDSVYQAKVATSS